MNNEQYKYVLCKLSHTLLIDTLFTVHCSLRVLETRIFGRSAEIRTRGLLNPIQARYHLRHTPTSEQTTRRYALASSGIRLATLLLLSIANPLRWALRWFRRKNDSLLCCSSFPMLNHAPHWARHRYTRGSI